MATEVLQLGIDSTGAAQGARQFERATTSVQQSATKADAAASKMDGSFDKLRRQVLLAERALGALGLTIGAGALVRSIARATADMDTLRRSLDAVTGSGAETARQLKELREVAKLPGLGFKEAVQGAVNLEVVGFSAQKTTQILKDFGNAVALTGGGKNELDRVIFQFTQMASLGKVTSQDLKPIIQTAPAVAKAMLQVFGTISPDKIAAKGLTFDEFVDRLLKGLEKLPAATGGVRNSFENLTDATFQASAAFGQSFAGSVASVLDPLSKSLLALADNADAMRKLADGAKSLAKALGVIGLGAAVYYLADAFGALLISSTPLLAAMGPAGVLVAGATILTALFYKQGAAAREAAKGADEYAKSLAKMNRTQTIAEFRDVQRRIEGLKQMAPTSFVVGEINKLGAQRQMILGQLDSMRPQPRQPTPPAAVDTDTLAKALGAAFDRVAARLGSAMSQIGMRPANNEDFLSARQDNPFDVKYKPRPSIFLPVQRTVQVPTVPALDVPTRFDSLRASAAKFGGGVKDQIAGLAAQFGPLALAAAALKPAFDGLRAVLGPVLSKLARPLEVMGRILGDVVAPVLEMIQAPLESVATLFSVLAQPLKLSAEIITAFVAPGLNLLGKVLKTITGGLSYIVEGIGYVVKGLGELVDKLVPDFISHAGKGLAKTGQEIIDGAERARRGFDAVATASDKLAASISTDLPKAINLALYRARIGAPGGGVSTGGPASGGGIGGGYHPPVYTPGNHPPPAPAGGVVVSIGSYHSAANETPEDAARKMAKGAQILKSQGVTLYAPLVTAA